MSESIQLNADLGEGAQVEDLLMPHLSFCNIACGGHYGDETSMRDALESALKYGVKIGAHPSYPDQENFGRVVMDISLEDLEDAIMSQLMDFKNVCRSAGAPIHHVKAHGALYHQIIIDRTLREVFLKIVYLVLGDVKIMLPSHVCAKDLHLDRSDIIYEAFGDRRYTDHLRLLPRSEKDAVLHYSEEIENQIANLIKEGKVVSNSGRSHSIQFDTICLHGDHQQLKTYFPILIQNLKDKGLL